MSLSFKVEHRDAYTVVRVEGHPTLERFLAFLQSVGVESPAWPSPRVLLDLRGIRSLTTVAEHRAIGEEAARQLHHLQRIASVVPADRITRASEQTARRRGIALTVFTDEGHAIAWLRA